MAKIVAIHDVGDIDTWLKGKAERADAIATMGGRDVRDHVAQDGSKTIAITAEVEDVDAMIAQLASPAPELMDAMQRHTVVPPVKVFVER